MASKTWAICCIFMLISHEIHMLPMPTEELRKGVAANINDRPTAASDGFYEETTFTTMTPEAKKKEVLKTALTGAAVGAAIIGAIGAAGYAGYQHQQKHRTNTTVATGTINEYDPMVTKSYSDSQATGPYGAKIAGTMDPNTK
uniref:Early transcribed membrane protein n=1 Tax=Panagrolaimus sp. PS1159 TaxID=55785 RepID=A0AC35F440_9BILA